jgi:hypothetical protein
MVDTKTEPLSSDALTGIAIGIAGLGAAVLQLDWISRSLLISFVLALTIYAALRNSAHPILRILTALVIVGLFVGFGWRPIWEDFHAKYPAYTPEWLSSMARSFNIALAGKQPAPSQPPTPKRTESTWASAYYKCKNKGILALDNAAVERNSADFRAYIGSYAAAYNYKPVIVSLVPGGDKAELFPLKSDSYSTNKRTFQIIRVGRELTGVYSAEFNYNSEIYSHYLLISDSPMEVGIRKVIEALAKVEPGDCELQ